MDGLPDEFFCEHSGETYILDVERVEAEIDRLTREKAEALHQLGLVSADMGAMMRERDALRAALNRAYPSVAGRAILNIRLIEIDHDVAKPHEAEE